MTGRATSGTTLTISSAQPIQEQRSHLIEQIAQPIRRIQASDQVRRKLAGKIVESSSFEREELGLIGAKLSQVGLQRGARRIAGRLAGLVPRWRRPEDNLFDPDTAGAGV